MIYYFGGVAVSVLFFVSICYWAVNHFIKQSSEKSFQYFRFRLAREADLALKLFKEGLCEQIVQQENKSDSLAKLYANLIDLMQLGKDFTVCLGKDFELAQRRVRSIRELSDSFIDTYQKQSLHFSEEFCQLIDAFVLEQKRVVEHIEGNWNLTVKDEAENEKRQSLIKFTWHKFDDRISALMETLRAEFRSRQPAGSVMMKWLKEEPAPVADTSTKPVA